MIDKDGRIQLLMEGLEALAPMLDADGFSMALGDVADDGAVVLLHATPDACLDCLVPDEVLQQILLTELQRRDPSLVRVTVRKDFS